MNLTLDIVKDVLRDISDLEEIESTINEDGDEKTVIFKTEYDEVYLKVCYSIGSYSCTETIIGMEFVKPKKVTVSNFESI